MQQLVLTQANNTALLTLPMWEFTDGVHVFMYTFSANPSNSPILINYCVLAGPCPQDTEPATVSIPGTSIVFLRTCELPPNVDLTTGLLAVSYQWDYGILPSIIANTTGMDVVMPTPGIVSSLPLSRCVVR